MRFLLTHSVYNIVISLLYLRSTLLDSIEKYSFIHLVLYSVAVTIFSKGMVVRSGPALKYTSHIFFFIFITVWRFPFYINLLNKHDFFSYWLHYQIREVGTYLSSSFQNLPFV